MDTHSSAVWSETLKKEEKAHKKWLHNQNRGECDSDEEDPDNVAHYEAMLKKMPQQQRVSLRSIQLRRGGLSKKIGSWSDKECNPPRTPSQDVDMIKEKLPPIGPVISGDLDGYNAHTHIPGYTGFFPGRKCKEYLLLKRADPDTNAQLEDLCMRYSTKLAPPENRALKTTNQAKDNFGGKLRDPDMADWANHRKKSAITEYVRQAIRLNVNIKKSGH
jgi:hypothetical protein